MSLQQYKIGIVGCGTIGSTVARYVEDYMTHLKLIMVSDVMIDRANKIAVAMAETPRIVSVEEVVDNCDIVIESASVLVVPELVARVIDKGKIGIIISSGGLLDFAKNEELGIETMERLNSGKGKVVVPTGAVGGIDALKAMAIGGLDKVVHTVRKPPKALGMSNTVEEELFSGSARQAVIKYPRNVNVAATVALASLGFDLTQVRILSDPHREHNTHELYAKGNSGILGCVTENLPDPANPKTSQLAAFSLISTLRSITT